MPKHMEIINFDFTKLALEVRAIKKAYKKDIPMLDQNIRDVYENLNQEIRVLNKHLETSFRCFEMIRDILKLMLPVVLNKEMPDFTSGFDQHKKPSDSGYFH